MDMINFHYKSARVYKNLSYNSITKTEFKRFDANILNLGDLSKEGKNIDALAAIFDLEKFTSFCVQRDPHLVVPEYLSDFLKWLFGKIAEEFKVREDKNRVIIWGSLPFYAKFLGDGVLFLWDTKCSADLTGIGNIIICLLNICDSYSNEFIPKISKKFSNPPAKLRVGISRGLVISLGNGKDYVGSCINLAARLQKLNQLSFAVSRSGIDPQKCFSKSFLKHLILRKVNIRGVGKKEVVILLKEEFKNLQQKEKQKFCLL